MLKIIIEIKLIFDKVIGNENKWWGYIHTSGSLHAKRYFDERDIDEAMESPFCLLVFQAVYDSREAVIKAMEDHLENSKNSFDKENMI